MSMSNDIILSAYHGGLGDCLQFSTLPEEFYKQQGKKTFIWDQSQFRNPEIYELVWGKNPYICGIKSGKWNAGDTPEIIVENHTGNWISNWEYLHGLKPTNIRPKIYYEPKKLKLYANCILVDFSSISIEHGNGGYDVEKVEKLYQDLKLQYPDKKFINVVFNNYIGESKKYLPKCGDDIVKINSIFEYCDIINSSFGICCFYSGTLPLSISIQRFNENLKILCFVPSLIFNSERIQKVGNFYFDFIDYILI